MSCSQLQVSGWRRQPKSAKKVQSSSVIFQQKRVNWIHRDSGSQVLYRRKGGQEAMGVFTATVVYYKPL